MTGNFFHARLYGKIISRHALDILVQRSPVAHMEQALAHRFARQDRPQTQPDERGSSAASAPFCVPAPESGANQASARWMMIFCTSLVPS